MITEIKKIKNLRIFSNYPLKGYPCPVFNKHNIIYGMNGVGKTTLSKLFEIMASKGEMNKNGEEKKDYNSVKYEVIDDNGKICSSEDEIILPIRVFNRNYIEKNVQFEIGKTKPISSVLIGRELIEKKERLADLGQGLNRKNMLKIRFNAIVKKIESDIVECFRIARKDIRGDTGLSAVAYTAKHIKEDYNNLKFKPLSRAKLDEKKKILADKPKNKQKPIKLKEREEYIFGRARELCKATSIPHTVIDKKRRHQMHQGPDAIHSSHIVSEKIIFNEYEIKENLADSIRGQKEFSSRILERRLTRYIDNLINKIETREAEIGSITILNTNALHQDFKVAYVQGIKRLAKSKEVYLQWLQEIKGYLNAKKQKMDKEIELDIKTNFDAFFDDIEMINDTISQHNNKPQYSESDKLSACNDIKRHYLASISSQIKEMEDKVEKYKARVGKVETGILDAESEIKKLEKRTHGISAACEYINLYIKRFFGREEIKFSPSENGDSYHIERDGLPTTSLSEGEKTAVAFIYFMSELRGKDKIRDKNEMQIKAKTQDNSDKPIVVIDDPVSSLDNNFLHNSFSLIVELTKKDIEQLFIFTHNFEFLRMLLGYYNSRRGKKNTCGYFMVKNKMVKGKRSAYIDQLDKTLEDFNNEYQYLFYKLYEFKENEDASLDVSYPIPNMMRKFLEIFLEFQAPEKGSIVDRLKALKKEDLNDYEISEIVKFLNENSHGNNIELDPNIIENSKKLSSCIFEIVRYENENHYARMVKYIEGTDSFKKKNEELHGGERSMARWWVSQNDIG